MRELPRQIKGMRVDPSYLYQDHFRDLGVQDAATATTIVLNDAVELGVNLLFFYTYNPIFGAFYNTQYPDTQIEEGFGEQDLLRLLLERAGEQDLPVVAVLPVNHFKSVWVNHPEWRSKLSNGSDYVPEGTDGIKYYLLSAWHDEFRVWLEGFVDDLLDRYPSLHGIEAVEALVSLQWSDEVDHNSACLKKFHALYPLQAIQPLFWETFRAQGLTELHAIMGQCAHSHGNSLFFVSQPWTIDSNGHLVDSSVIRRGSGVNCHGICGLPKTSRPDYLIGEFLWQQWQHEHSDVITFNPAWTATAASQFSSKVGQRVKPITHVEITQWANVAPTVEEFKEALSVALANSDWGVSFYDYAQIRERPGAMDAVKSVYRREE